MSSGPLTPDKDLSKLAPKMRLAVEAFLEECRNKEVVLPGGTGIALDATVWEAMRSNELQALYYTRGRHPVLDAQGRPTGTWDYDDPIHHRGVVTNARSNRFSWHGYGLAVDIVSTSHFWFARAPSIRNPVDERPMAGPWFRAMADVAKRHGLDWGGDWIGRKSDPPHVQWGTLNPSPSDRGRQLLDQGGLPAVWAAVGAV